MAGQGSAVCILSLTGFSQTRPPQLPKTCISVDKTINPVALVIPVGAKRQELVVLEKFVDGSLRHSSIAGVRFVPMTGEA